MCTAISDTAFTHLFGRTLDLEHSYKESVVITPRGFRSRFLWESAADTPKAIIGMAHVANGIPLYYDAMNESGLAVAALNFPGCAVYRPYRQNQKNLASFELIPWVLTQCDSLQSAIARLEGVNVTTDRAAEDLPPTPLHFLIADSSASAVLEPTESGLCIYENPFGVLTNSPAFSYHKTHLAEFLHVSSAPPENHIASQLPIVPYSRGMGGYGLPGDYSSASRFVRAVFAKSHTVPATERIAAIGRFFHLLETVSLPDGISKTETGLPIRTVYTSCMDTDAGTYYFTTYESRRIRAVSLRDADLLGDTLTAISIHGAEDICHIPM